MQIISSSLLSRRWWKKWGGEGRRKWQEKGPDIDTLQPRSSREFMDNKVTQIPVTSLYLWTAFEHLEPTKRKHGLADTLEHCRQVRSGPLYLKLQFASQTLQLGTLPYKASIPQVQRICLCLDWQCHSVQASCSWSSNLPKRSASLGSNITDIITTPTSLPP